MLETIERVSVPLNRQAAKNQQITDEGFNWRKPATTSELDRHTDTAARSQSVEDTQLASLPPLNGTLGTLACSSSVPVCHTRKGGKRHASPASSGEQTEESNARRLPKMSNQFVIQGRSGTGRIESIRSVLSLLDDAELLERSRGANA